MIVPLFCVGANITQYACPCACVMGILRCGAPVPGSPLLAVLSAVCATLVPRRSCFDQVAHEEKKATGEDSPRDEAFLFRPARLSRGCEATPRTVSVESAALPGIPEGRLR